MSQAWQIHPGTSPSHDEYDPSILTNLVLRDISPRPAPGPKQALVRIRAAALNFRDLLIVADSPHYPVRSTRGLVPCSDGAGEVVAIGEGSFWNVGQRVILKPNQSWVDGDAANFDVSLALGGGGVQGTLQRYRVVGDEWLLNMPGHLSWEEAAAMPTAGSTAINALFHNAGGQKADLSLLGKTVLTQGTGGVSCFAIQIASAAGARVIATSSSDQKLQEAKKMGADELINYKKTPSWADEVLKVTGGKGVDLVVEVGGAGTIEQSLKAAKLGGTVVVIGILTASKQADLIPAILYGAKTVRGSLGTSKIMANELVEMVSKHNIRPVIGRIFEWQDAPQAFEHMMKQGTIGKIVVKV